jgi:hypothetical protein
MGQSSSNTSSQSTTAPTGAGASTLQSILGQLNPLVSNSGITPTQSSAINQLTANGMAGDQFAPAIANSATSLLNGGGATSQNPNLTANLNTFDSNIGQIAGAAPGSSTVNSPAVQAALQAANTGIANQVNSEFAAAGRSGSGMNTQTLAQGEELADAPIILNQANQDAANQVTTANNLFNAGNTTSNAITGNNQTALGNQLQGTTQASSAITAQNEGPTAAIEAQELGQQIPAQNLGLLAQIGIPIAGLSTSTNGTSNTTSDPSLLSELTSLGGLFSSSGTNGVSAINGIGNSLSSLGSAASSGLGSLAGMFAM